MSELLLIHGGLWGESDADRFWRVPGVVAALEDRGVGVIAPDRPPRPRAWRDEVGHLAAALRGSVCVVAGSNGCPVGVLLALAHPELVDGLVLAWPATAGDVDVDAWTRSWLTEGGADTSVADALLAGETLRGVSDAEVRAVGAPVGIVPSASRNPFHQRRTVDALRRLSPGAVLLPGCPEPPSPDFDARPFAAAVLAFAAGLRPPPTS